MVGKLVKKKFRIFPCGQWSRVFFFPYALEDFEEKTEGLWTEEASLSPALRDF